MSETHVPAVADVYHGMSGMDIVKEGYLFVKRPPGHKWSKFRVSSAFPAFAGTPFAVWISQTNIRRNGATKKNPVQSEGNVRSRDWTGELVH